MEKNILSILAENDEGQYKNDAMYPKKQYPLKSKKVTGKKSKGTLRPKFKSDEEKLDLITKAFDTGELNALYELMGSGGQYFQQLTESNLALIITKTFLLTSNDAKLSLNHEDVPFKNMPMKNKVIFVLLRKAFSHKIDKDLFM